ncbi:hypothetical protein COLU111180_12625 [Cohnella lubricantis]|uniref:DUF1453 family protein n=1 Tax=Cohnella lubricantis TaxID=2163172 RepID=A0A841T7W7_9BACL|nr:hypothetical protein [Cohnella lubricantis]MBB6676075.1 hypothetical protein [Cohnella lubricantis]MBP2118030.1 hypothetical protein [Cohnella lubricantis]
MNMQYLAMVLLIAIIGYRIYLRVRRTFVWQQLRLGRLRLKTILLSVIGLLFFAEGVFPAEGGLHAVSLISDIVGIAFGAILAYYSRAKTAFEQRGACWFYRPNAWIGGFVTVLFLGRLLYRIYGMLHPAGDPSAMTWAERMNGAGSSWTSGLILIMFAYYVTYNILLMRKRRSVEA